MKVSINELVSVFSLVKDATPIGFVVRKPVEDMVKKHRDTKEPNPYLGRVVKVQHVNAMVNTNYERAVNRRREREGIDETFVAQPRKWGERIKGTPLITHNGQAYLECQLRSSSSTYFVDGKEATPEQLAEIRQYLPTKKPSKSQGVENEVVLRDYSLKGIETIRINKQDYAIG